MAKYGIVVNNIDVGFEVLLNLRIYADSEELATMELRENPPLFIPQDMMFYPFKIVTQEEIRQENE